MAEKIKVYEFTVYVVGRGVDAKEAWSDCVDTILTEMRGFSDTNDLPEHKVIEVTDEEAD